MNPIELYPIETIVKSNFSNDGQIVVYLGMKRVYNGGDSGDGDDGDVVEAIYKLRGGYSNILGGIEDIRDRCGKIRGNPCQHFRFKGSFISLWRQ